MMDAFLTYLDMGGYAVWVWSSYGLATLGLGAVLVVSRRTLKAREREFEALKALRRGEGANR